MFFSPKFIVELLEFDDVALEDVSAENLRLGVVEFPLSLILLHIFFLTQDFRWCHFQFWELGEAHGHFVLYFTRNIFFLFFLLFHQFDRHLGLLDIKLAAFAHIFSPLRIYVRYFQILYLLRVDMELIEFWQRSTELGISSARPKISLTHVFTLVGNVVA